MKPERLLPSAQNTSVVSTLNEPSSIHLYYNVLQARPIPSTLISFFLMAQQAPVDQGLLLIEASRSHSHTAHSVGLLWTSNQPDAETSTRKHTTLTRDRHPCPRRDSNPQSQQTSGCSPTT